ncbi:head-tail connector protein [Pseudoruegeria sp. HB172150]|uniref:head-tail connector protein n=1 Tax=Pseudoruegeria sp. HB172150 TaxID=2721164 RepID=UPI001554D2F7|nr:head-tail connector protein [Pseudoruegeria sp. HB172150]
MMLVEQTTVATEALPVTEFKDHLRLGSGFSDDGVQDTVLEGYVRSALAAIEARTGKVLYSRVFVWTLDRWRELARQALPVAPVTAVSGVRLFDRDGAETVIAADKYRLQMDSQRPRLVSTVLHLPLIPTHGTAEVTFTAGFGTSWDDIPADLCQAVLLLAAHYYENRSAVLAGEAPVPFGVSLLIDRYRTVRLFGEGGAR